MTAGVGRSAEGNKVVYREETMAGMAEDEAAEGEVVAAASPYANPYDSGSEGTCDGITMEAMLCLIILEVAISVAWGVALCAALASTG